MYFLNRFLFLVEASLSDSFVLNDDRLVLNEEEQEDSDKLSNELDMESMRPVKCFLWFRATSGDRCWFNAEASDEKLLLRRDNNGLWIDRLGEPEWLDASLGSNGCVR